MQKSTTKSVVNKQQQQIQQKQIIEMKFYFKFRSPKMKTVQHTYICIHQFGNVMA